MPHLLLQFIMDSSYEMQSSGNKRNQYRQQTNSIDDEDATSHASRNSYNTQSSTFNSDTEYKRPSISVRDMVERYNSAVKRGRENNTEFVTKTSRNDGGNKSPTPRLFSKSPPVQSSRINKYNSNTEVVMEDGRSSTKSHKHRSRHQNRSSNNSPSVKINDAVGVEAEETSDTITHSSEKDSLELEDDDDNHDSTMESSYHSKTTIAKTTRGVRIIIDIFFDQDECVNIADVVGRRVETDIPHSRILNEFQHQQQQQQSMSSNIKKTP